MQWRLAGSLDSRIRMRAPHFAHRRPVMLAALTAALGVAGRPLAAGAQVRPMPVALPPGVPAVIKKGSGQREVTPFYASYGTTLMAIQPRSDLARYAKRGFGAAFQGYMGLDKFGIAGLRGDASHLLYGANRYSDTAMTNNISSVVVGPQVTIPWGPIRPYVSVGGGLTHLFSTISYDCEPVEECGTTWNEETDEYETETRVQGTGHHRLTYAWSRRAGVSIAVHRLARTRTRLALDVSVGEQGNGRTAFGIPGEKEKVAFGKTRYRVWLVGVSVMNR